VNLYYTAIPLSDQPTIARVEFRQVSKVGQVKLWGFGFFDKEREQVAQFYNREKYTVAFRDSSVLIEENTAAFPRAFAVPEAIFAESAKEALDLLAFGPIDPRRQVVLEDAGAWTEQPIGADEPTSPGALSPPYGAVELLEYHGESVALAVESEGGFLVLTDAYYPGWKAYVDGTETSIFRANYLFRAIALPAGAHLVQFRYEPRSFAIGLAISQTALLALLVALLATFLPLSRKRSGPARQARRGNSAQTG
jgi:hypothetical protein